MGEALQIRITVDRRVVLTTAQAAARHGMDAVAMRKELSRYAVAPVAYLDGRTPLYAVVDVDRMIRERPGRGRRA